MAWASENSNQVTAIATNDIQTIEVLSVEPTPSPYTATARRLFHHFPVLGSRRIDDPSVIRNLIDSLNRQIIPRPSGNMCIFVPRHGLIVKYKDRTVDYLICYHCGDVARFEGEKYDSLSLRSGPPSKGLSKELLDDLLSKVGIPLAP